MANYSVYPGTVSGQPLQLGRDLVSSGISTPHYLFFRGGEYDYYMIIGDLEYNNGSFSFTDADVYQYNYAHTQQNQYYYAMYLRRESGSVSNPYSATLYSDLGSFPQLLDRGGVTLEASILFSVVLLTLYIVIRDLFFPLLHR